MPSGLEIPSNLLILVNVNTNNFRNTPVLEYTTYPSSSLTEMQYGMTGNPNRVTRAIPSPKSLRLRAYLC